MNSRAGESGKVPTQDEIAIFFSLVGFFNSRSLVLGDKRENGSLFLLTITSWGKNSSCWFFSFAQVNVTLMKVFERNGRCTESLYLRHPLLINLVYYSKTALYFTSGDRITTRQTYKEIHKYTGYCKERDKRKGRKKRKSITVHSENFKTENKEK